MQTETKNKKEYWLSKLTIHGIARLRFLTAVIDFLSLESKVRLVISGAMKEEHFATADNKTGTLQQCINIEKNKLIELFRGFSNSYIQSVGSYEEGQFFEKGNLVDLVLLEPEMAPWYNGLVVGPHNRKIFNFARQCVGTPLSRSCRRGSLEKVKLMLRYRTLWKTVWDVQLEPRTLVNMCIMPFPSCLQLGIHPQPTIGPWYTRVAEERDFTDIDPSLFCRHSQHSPLSVTLDKILTFPSQHHCLHEDVDIIEDGWRGRYMAKIEEYLRILHLLLDKGAEIKPMHLYKICMQLRDTTHHRVNVQNLEDANTRYTEDFSLWKMAGRIRVRLLVILLPYFTAQMKTNLLKGFITSVVVSPKILYMDSVCCFPEGVMGCITYILSQGPVMDASAFNRDGIEEMYSVPTNQYGSLADCNCTMSNLVNKLVVEDGDGYIPDVFPGLIGILKQLLSYDKWVGTPAQIVVNMHPTYQKRTVADSMHLAFGTWQDQYKQVYLEMLHPYMIRNPSNCRYLSSLIKQEAQWAKEGGVEMIKKWKMNFMQDLWTDRQVFLEKELKKGLEQMERVKRGGFNCSDRRELMKVFPNHDLCRTNGIARYRRTAKVPSTEFHVTITNVNRERNAEKKKIIDTERRFRDLWSKIAERGKKRKGFGKVDGEEIAEMEWYEIFGELFLYDIPMWKENGLLKEYFETRIREKSRYGIWIPKND